MITRIEINLLPAEYRIHIQNPFLQRQVIYPLVTMVILGCGMAFAQIYLNMQKREYEKMIAQTELLISQNMGILDEIKALKSQKAITQAKIRALERINVNREQWLRLQELFCMKLPETSWLERIEQKKDTANLILEVEGKTLSFGEVAQYMTRLKESEFVRQLDLIRIEQTNQQDRTFKFLLICTLNPDVGLKPQDET